MVLLRFVLLSLLMGVTVFLIAPLFFNSQISIKKSVAITIPPEEIMPFLSQHQYLKKWEPWYLYWRNPDLHQDLNTMQLEQNPGRVTWEIEATTNMVLLRTSVKQPFSWEHQSQWRLTSIKGGTKVEYLLAQKVSYPLGRWKLFLMEDNLDKYAKASILNLKQICEQPKTR